jgi:hypothetical protein
MNDTMRHFIVLGGLSCVFGSYGIWTLVAAYRTDNLTDWASRSSEWGGRS